MQIFRLHPLLILLGLISPISLHAQAESQTESLAHKPPVDLIFVTIPGGQFVMGTTNLKEAIAELPDPKTAMIKDETPAHTVAFKKPFQLSQTEVTQKIWLNVMHSKPGPA